MLMQQTLDKLESIGLHAMAAALREQVEQAPQYRELSFEDWSYPGSVDDQ